MRFRRLLSALRLFDPARVALGPVAWERSGAGPWSLGDLGTGGRPHGVLEIAAEAEDELRAFVSLVTRRTPRAGELAWALRRYELGCERPALFEALTDHLLALRALLEPEGPASGRLAGRVAALCATEEQRARVTERVAHAVSLERAVIAGLAPSDGGIQVLLAELTAHLRALLRDVLCGHLDSDLRAVADQLLARGRRRRVTRAAGCASGALEDRAGCCHRGRGTRTSVHDDLARRGARWRESALGAQLVARLWVAVRGGRCGGKAACGGTSTARARSADRQPHAPDRALASTAARRGIV